MTLSAMAGGKSYARRSYRRALRTLGVLLIICASLAFASAAKARTSLVNGVSDQNLARWDNAALNVSSFSSGYFPNYFHAVWVGHVQLARFVVPWDVMGDASGETLHFELFRAWLEDVKWLGLTPEVAIEQAEQTIISGGVELKRVPTSSAQYEQYVSALLNYTASVGEPAKYLEAWNEPNNSGLGPVNIAHPSAAGAAHFMNTASALCASHGCSAIAGDFLDSTFAYTGHGETKEGSTGMGLNYENEYETELNPKTPAYWGFHPYAAVKYNTTETIGTFTSHLPSHVSVSFTEVGAYLCQPEGSSQHHYSEAEQAAHAGELNTLLADFEIEHAFYYEFSNGWGSETNCAEGPDTSLYNAADQQRAAAKVIYGGTIPSPPPSVVTGPASSIEEEQGKLTGTVDPDGATTHYYFEYGATASYGSDTPSYEAGAGINSIPVSAGATGLEPEMTYHFRLVASSAFGTSYGSDQAFTSAGHQGLQLAVDGPNHTLDYYENYVNEPWNKVVLGAENTTDSTPSVVRFKDQYGKGLQLVVQGANHTLDFYTKYDGEPWSKVVIAGENSTYGSPSMVRFSDAYGTGVQVVVEGGNHTLDFYTDYDNQPWSGTTVIGGVNSTYGTPSMVRFNDKYGTGLQLAVQGANNTLDFYTNYDNAPWGSVVIGGVNSTYGTPSMVRFNDKYGTGLQLAVEGANHTLDFYTDYDNAPWGSVVIGGANSTYGTPSMVRFNDKYGTGLQLAVQGANNALDFYTNYDNSPWGSVVIGGVGSTYGSPSMVRFSNRFGTGLQLTVEGVGHTLDFYSDYDNQPWGSVVIGGESSTYGTPSMVSLHAPKGSFEL